MEPCFSFRSPSPLMNTLTVVHEKREEDVDDPLPIYAWIYQNVIEGIASIIQRIQKIWEQIVSYFTCSATESDSPDFIEEPPVAEVLIHDQTSTLSSPLFSSVPEFIQLGSPIHFERLKLSADDQPLVASSSAPGSTSPIHPAGLLRSSISIRSSSQRVYQSNIMFAGRLQGSLKKVPDHILFFEKKRGICDYFLENAPEEGSYTLTKYTLFDRQRVSDQGLFASALVPDTFVEEGDFPYPHSDDSVKHWTVHFANHRLFEHCFEQVLTQEEVQVMEHPALYSLKLDFARMGDFDVLQSGQVALLEDVLRLGKVGITACLSDDETLCDHHFTSAANEEIEVELERFDDPHASNIFAMVAPAIPSECCNQPYLKETLEELFYTAYTAFTAVKERSRHARPIVHTGNWGCDGSGHEAGCVALIQVAAARLAGVELHYYALDSTPRVQGIIMTWMILRNQQWTQNWTVDQFLNYLVDEAGNFGLLYQPKASN